MELTFYAYCSQTHQLISKPNQTTDKYECVIPSCHQLISIDSSSQDFVHNCEGSQEEYKLWLACRQVISHFYHHPKGIIFERYCFHFDRDKTLTSSIHYSPNTHILTISDQKEPNILLTCRGSIPYEIKIILASFSSSSSSSPFHHEIRVQDYQSINRYTDISQFALTQKCATCTKEEKQRLARLKRPCMGVCKKWISKTDMTEIRDEDGISSFLCKVCQDGRPISKIIKEMQEQSSSGKRKVQKRECKENETKCPMCEYPIKKEQLERYHRCYRCNKKIREQRQQEEEEEEGDKDKNGDTTQSSSSSSSSSFFGDSSIRMVKIGGGEPFSFKS